MISEKNYFSFHIALPTSRRNALIGLMSSTTANTSTNTGAMASFNQDQRISTASYSMSPRVGRVDRELSTIRKGKGRDPKHQLVSFHQPTTVSYRSIGMLTKRKLSLQAPSLDVETPQRLCKSGTRSKSRTTGEIQYTNTGRGRQEKLLVN